jgi:predicted secreted hydrolase
MQRREFMRRALLVAGASSATTCLTHAAAFAYAPVEEGTALQFPRDYGAHPDHRIEWWYVTGWLDRDASGNAPLCGFQVTFFRVRTPLPAGSSRFTATQLLFVHAAVSDPRVGHILHEERAARAGFGLAEAAVGDSALSVRDWRLRRAPAGDYHATLLAREFTLRLAFQPTQPLMLQGRDGYSQKGPAVENASFYYSEPHLRVEGEIVVRGRRETVTGRAWLDHEWSSALMPPGAAGWDWLGLNLDDGGAVMAFQMRSHSASAPALWSSAKLRLADRRVVQPARGDIRFTPTRHWTSPQGSRYPVQCHITLGSRTLHLRPLLDAQELTTQHMGATYWEGAVTAHESAAANAQRIGRGYWELTGYRKPVPG